MAGSALHRVRRLRWQARAPSTADAFALRTLLRDRGEAVHTAIEQACAAAQREAGDADTVWHVPRLVLRIQAADVRGLDADLPGRVALALRDALSDAGIGAPAASAPPARVAPTSARSAQPGLQSDPAPLIGPDIASASRAQAQAPDAHARGSLRHYLHTGGLDWALAGLADGAAQTALQQAALQATQALLAGRLALDSLLPLPAWAVAARGGALLRWLQLLPADWRLQWLAASPAPAGLKPALQQAWLQGLRDGPPQDSLPWMALWLAWGALPGSAAGSPKTATLPAAPALRAWIAAQLASAPPGPAASASWLPALRKALGPAPPAEVVPGVAPLPTPGAHPLAAPQPADASGASPALLVPLAGLVLLHPYLPRFLAGCGVLAPGGRAIPSAQLPRACSLLLALACGGMAAFEHQLPLVKLLLGEAPDAPLNTPLPRLAPADVDEVDALLAAVRAHWAALRGTGVDGLRLSFLQRRGLLRRTDGAWQLHVQAEPFDVLLDLLPWGISLVKLPWMPQPLMVAWP